MPQPIASPSPSVNARALWAHPGPRPATSLLHRDDLGRQGPSWRQALWDPGGAGAHLGFWLQHGRDSLWVRGPGTGAAVPQPCKSPPHSPLKDLLEFFLVKQGCLVIWGRALIINRFNIMFIKRCKNICSCFCAFAQQCLAESSFSACVFS